MRNSKTVRLARGLLVTVHEFTVEDVIIFLNALGDVDYNDDAINKYIQTNPIDFYNRINSLVCFEKSTLWSFIPHSWLFKIYLEQLMTIMLDVNSAYFVHKKTAIDTKRLKPKKCSAVASGLRNALEVLIREGHTNPQSYGWFFFMNACEYQEKLSKNG